MIKAKDMKHFMQVMGIDEMPEIFVSNWDAAMSTFPDNGIRFLTDEYIEQSNKVLFLTDDKLRFFYSAAEMIRSDMELSRYVWLWHYCMFVIEPFPDLMEVLSWPFPETQMGSLGQMFHGVVLLSGLDWLKRLYDKRGIPLKILIDTLSEFDICLDEHKAKYGEYGIGIFRIRWLYNHFAGRIFRLGRLEFMFSRFGGDYNVYRNIHDGRAICIYRQGSNGDSEFDAGYQILDSGFRDDKIIRLPLCDWREVLKNGTGRLEVHITLGEKLSTDSCRKSLAMAIDFYARHFPEQSFELFTCQSWLMDPQLSVLLPEKTNIVRFQKLFNLYPTIFSNTDVFRFAFDLYDVPTDLATLPERSSMHKALKAHLLKGKSILSSGGFILKEEYEKGAGIESYEMMYSGCCGENCSMTSRERVLSAVRREYTDYVPCSPFFNGFCSTLDTGNTEPFPWGDSDREMAEYNKDKLGMDPILTVDVEGFGPIADVMYHDCTKADCREWTEAETACQDWDGAETACQDRANGKISAALKENDERLVFNMNSVKSIADQYHLATVCRIGWSGCCCTAEEGKRDLPYSQLDLGHRFNMRLIEAASQGGMDIILLDGFYGIADFQYPEEWKYTLLKYIGEEIDLVHSCNKTIGFVLRADNLHMLDLLVDLDFDSIVNFDVVFEDSYLTQIIRRFTDKKSFWICPDSVCEKPPCSAGEVEKAVKKVYDTFGKQGLLITACASSKCIMTWENTLVMAKGWRKFRIAP